MFCEGCGKHLGDDANFCKQCGRAVVQDDDPDLDIVYVPRGDGYERKYARHGQLVSRGRTELVPVPVQSPTVRRARTVEESDDDWEERFLRGAPERSDRGRSAGSAPPGTRRAAEIQARTAVDQWSAAAVAISWLPGSTFGLAAADMSMIRNVAGCFGVGNFDTEAAVATIAASATGRYAAELLVFAGPLGLMIKAAIAAGITKAVGEKTISYFRNLSPLPE